MSEHQAGDLAHETTRGGIVIATDREVEDDDILAIFIVGDTVAPRTWCAQAMPEHGDMILQDAIGLEGEEDLEVRARLWRASNLVVIGCAPIDERSDEGAELANAHEQGRAHGYQAGLAEGYDLGQADMIARIELQLSHRSGSPHDAGAAALREAILRLGATREDIDPTTG